MKRPALLILPCLLPLGSLVAQAPRQAAFSGVRSTATAPPLDGSGERHVTGSFGIDVPTAYFWRGIQYENQGLLAQPHLELVYPITAEAGTEPSFDLIVGTWSSFHTGPTGIGGGNSAWFESDFYLGVSSSFAERWNFTGTYSWYGSPQDGTSSEELTLALGYDDADVWFQGIGGLQPAVLLGIETKGQADGGNDKGVFAQIGVEPTFLIGSNGSFDCTMTLPVSIGVSLANYYEDAGGSDAFFGFLDVGVDFSSPLPMIPTRFGPWNLGVSLHALMLGDTTEEFNQGDGLEWIFSVGLSTTW